LYLFSRSGLYDSWWFTDLKDYSIRKEEEMIQIAVIYKDVMPETVNVTWNDYCLHVNTHTEETITDYMTFEGVQQYTGQVEVCDNCEEVFYD